MAKYDELSTFLIELFNLEPDIFEINYDDQTPVFEDIRIRNFQEFKMNNGYFNSYYYKDNIEQGWESVVLNMNRAHISGVFTRINEFLDKQDIELIDLNSYEEALRENTNFQFDRSDDNIIFLVGVVSTEAAFIDIARIKE